MNIAISAPRFCHVCRAWMHGPARCPVCSAPLGDELAPGLRVQARRSHGRETHGWSREERFGGVVLAVSQHGPWPLVRVACAGEQREVWLGGLRPDTALSRAADAAREALGFVARWSEGADLRAWVRSEERKASAGQRGRVGGVRCAK